MDASVPVTDNCVLTLTGRRAKGWVAPGKGGKGNGASATVSTVKNKGEKSGIHVEEEAERTPRWECGECRELAYARQTTARLTRSEFSGTIWGSVSFLLCVPIEENTRT